MSNSKRKCTGCKKRFPQEGMLPSPVGFFCDIDCRLEYATKNSKKLAAIGSKIRSKASRADLTAFNRKDIGWQHKQTQKRFNRLRVLQEIKWFRDNNQPPTCISCGKENMDWCCGHFKTVGAQGALRYDELNTYLQCNRYCNMGLSGNISGNKSTRGYIKGLHERFGEEKATEIIDYCESNSASRKWTCDEVEAIRKEANAMIRKLESELGL